MRRSYDQVVRVESGREATSNDGESVLLIISHTIIHIIDTTTNNVIHDIDMYYDM